MAEKIVDNQEVERFNPDAMRDMQATSGDVAVFQPTTFGEAMELAALMCQTHAVPPHLRGMNSKADCLAVITQSARWGMDPFAVANKSYFVNDRIAYEAQLINAVVQRNGNLDGRLRIKWDGDGQNLVCTVTGKFKGDDHEHEVIQELATITTKNSPLWKQAPRQQIAYFTTRLWARLHAPGALMGVLAPDEAEQLAPIRATRTPAAARAARPQAGDYDESGEAIIDVAGNGSADTDPAEPGTGDETEIPDYEFSDRIGEITAVYHNALEYVHAVYAEIEGCQEPAPAVAIFEGNENTLFDAAANISDADYDQYYEPIQKMYDGALADIQAEKEKPEPKAKAAGRKKAKPAAKDPEPEAEPAEPETQEQDPALAAFKVKLRRGQDGEVNWLAFFNDVKNLAVAAVVARDIQNIRDANKESLLEMLQKSRSHHRQLNNALDRFEADLKEGPNA